MGFNTTSGFFLFAYFQNRPVEYSRKNLSAVVLSAEPKNPYAGRIIKIVQRSSPINQPS